MGKPKTFPVFIPFEEATERYHIDYADIEAAIERGLVRAVFAAEDGHGRLLVSEEDVDFVCRLPYFPDVKPESRFLSLREAAKQYKLDERTLIDALQFGIIETAEGAEGGLCVSEKLASESQDALKIARKARKLAQHVAGKPIHISEAARKYDIPQATLSRWVQRGYIRKVGQDKNRVLLDEGDVAYCVNVYNLMNGGQGKRIFQKGGLPYIPKHSKEESQKVVA